MTLTKASNAIPEWLMRHLSEPPALVSEAEAAEVVQVPGLEERRLAAIPGAYRRAVEAIRTGALPDNPMFRRLRKAWTGTESVLVVGPRGVGKSVAMAWAAERAVLAGSWIQWLDAPDIPGALREVSHGGRDLVRDAQRAPLAVLDELHRAEGLGDGSMMALVGIINARHRAGLPTLAAATTSLEELVAIVGEELVDRFTVRLVAEGESYRPKAVI